MDALEILSEFTPKPFLSLYEIEVLSVAVTLVVYACMLVIAVGVVNRGSSLGVPLKNFLSGLIMSSLGIVFAEPGSETTPAGLMNKCGVTVQGFVCLVILGYSQDFNTDARLAAAALVVFSILMNLKDQALLVMLVWSAVHLVLIPGSDYLKARKAGASTPPDNLVLTLYLSGSLSLIGWGTYVYLIGLPTLALPYFLGVGVTMLSLKDMYATSKSKTS